MTQQSNALELYCTRNFGTGTRGLTAWTQRSKPGSHEHDLNDADAVARPTGATLSRVQLVVVRDASSQDDSRTCSAAATVIVEETAGPSGGSFHALLVRTLREMEFKFTPIMQSTFW